MKIRFIFFLLIVLISNAFFGQNASNFKVVLDAGHGGKDHGAIKNGLREKEVALDVVLKVGKILEKEKDIDVIYSRKTDVFVELRERANNANKEKANLFVSIHCNSNNSSKPYGALTLVMGMSRKNTNFEIAKTENSVIFQEKDYKKKYKGFDPNKPETFIGLKILQEESLKSSIELAALLQDNFGNDLNRKNKGVHQQPLWVLDATFMPGVLIEMGFISNPEEARYLGSEKGKEEMAEAIAKAILEYKRNNFSVIDEVVTYSEPKEEIKSVKEVISEEKYKIQISTSKKKLDTIPSNFKGLKNISREYNDGFYKYFYGKASTSEESKKLLKEAKEKGYSSAFIVTNS